MNQNSKHAPTNNRGRIILTLFLISTAWIVTGCKDSATEMAASYGAQRTDAELDEVLLQACMQSNRTDKPILLQFGADWCSDCRRVEALKQDSALKEELQNWVDIKVNVGQYDRHKDLIQGFSVTSISRWIALRPNPETRENGCNSNPGRWIVLQDTVLEPVSDAKSLKTSSEIVAWLRQAGEKNQGPGDFH
ncbi:MAG TPA: hypothetical protein DEA96_02605 [Leptospiraceae bacterium]|nr:hypothetical protein [Spirochaetaceae bacterium]HBS03827.1 hypothetical protein [Leptospiraceae bacterium]|tara:strand:- start:36443 stop:37018 length:576 start_codon:yes stop_codon:yes gene_type:complete